MNKINSNSKRVKTAQPSGKVQKAINKHTNPYQTKVDLIKSFMVVHPLIDRLIEVKMNKCLQHGRVYQPNKRIEEENPQP